MRRLSVLLALLTSGCATTVSITPRAVDCAGLSREVVGASLERSRGWDQSQRLEAAIDDLAKVLVASRCEAAWAVPAISEARSAVEAGR